MVFEETPDNFSCLEVLAGPADNGLGEILCAARPGMAAAFDLQKDNCRICVPVRPRVLCYEAAVIQVTVGEFLFERYIVAPVILNP
jgi:hypothetical protein